MSTRGAVGMRPDGTVRAVYVHHDAYIAGVGAILGGWYEKSEKVEALLALGDLSSLGTTLADTVAYHRDRSERMKSARRYTNVDAYHRDGKGDFGADYFCLYDCERWLVYGISSEQNWVEIRVEK